MVVSVLFIMGGNMFGGFISKYVTVSSSNIRPSAESTFQVAVQAIKHNPFFGTGPNTFAIDWTQWRPSTIKNTEFWNVEFSQGVGSIPTLLVTTGILGFASVILFIFIFLFRAFKYVRLAFSNINKNYFLFMSFLLSLYGWILLFVYTPNILLWTITFASSGVFIGILVNKKNISVYSLSFTNNSRISFFSMLTIVVLMIMSVFGLYVYTKKIISIVYFSKGVSSTNTTAESLLKSETLLLNAISLDKNDLYYRTISQVYVAELNFILNDKSLSEDIIKSRAQSTIENIQKSANEAVSISPKNYQNWVNRGNVYSSMVTMGVDKAYENAVESYDNAFIFAPSNPGILLARAQLEFLKKNNESAKKYIEQSLVMKNDYLDAIFTMAQIQASEGNLPAAIKQAEYAATLYPNDSSVFFRLGILRYDNGEFGNAVNSFEASVVLDPSNLNARYMLGTSYLRLGRTDDAKVQFEILNKYIPDNVEVKRELEKIRNSSLVESKKNVNLPVTEKN
jgi:tetratricopeptide (TPR) repeat protein